VLGLLAGWAALRGLPGPGVQPIAAATPPGTAAPPEVTAPPDTAAPAPTAAVEDDPYVLVVEDPFEGKPHSMIMLPAVEFPEYSPEGAYAVDYGASQDQIITRLTAEDMLHLLGREDQVPWILGWSGFTLTGYGEFDGAEELRQAVILGVNRTDQGTIRFTLQLSPGAIPPSDLIYPEARTQDYSGVPVTVYCVPDSGAYTYYAEFMSGDTGVRFHVSGVDRALLADRVHGILAAALGTYPFTTEGLAVQEEHVSFRQRALTLEEAYPQDLKEYLPRLLPEGFTLGAAVWSQLSQEEADRLSATWNRGYDYINLWISNRPGEYEQDAPVLSAASVTAGALEEVGEYVDSDRGDVPGWRYHFVVEYPEGFRAAYRIKGLSPWEAAQVVNSCAHNLCSLPPAPTPAQ